MPGDRAESPGGRRQKHFVDRIGLTVGQCFRRGMARPHAYAVTPGSGVTVITADRVMAQSKGATYECLAPSGLACDNTDAWWWEAS